MAGEALDFVAQEPAAARVLLLDSLGECPHGFRRYVGLIEHFAMIAVIAAAHLRAGKPTELVAAGPESVELILLPCLGAGEAKRWAPR